MRDEHDWWLFCAQFCPLSAILASVILESPILSRGVVIHQIRCIALYRCISLYRNVSQCIAMYQMYRELRTRD